MGGTGLRAGSLIVFNLRGNLRNAWLDGIMDIPGVHSFTLGRQEDLRR